MSNLSIGRWLGHSKASLTLGFGRPYTWRVFLQNPAVCNRGAAGEGRPRNWASRASDAMERVMGPRGFNNVKGDLMRVRSKAILAVDGHHRGGGVVGLRPVRKSSGAEGVQGRQYGSIRLRIIVKRRPSTRKRSPHPPDSPEAITAYFFLGNSYDNLYKPARKGEAENDTILTKAIENYKISAESETRPEHQEAGAGVSGQCLRSGQARRSDAGRADRAADDTARPDRHRRTTSPLPRSTRMRATWTRPRPC